MIGEAFVGTASLTRLVLRRDRIRLAIWFVILVALLLAQVAGLREAYPDESDRLAYASVMSGSAAARVFGAPDGPSLGAITMVEIYATLGVLAAIMCAMGVVRHTRKGEETGRLELVGATVVGRQASLAAPLIVYTAVMLLYAIAGTAVLVALELPARGSFLLAASVAGTGIVFAGVAAVTSQLASSARVANGLAGLLIGVAFLLRAVGMVSGELRSDELGVVIAWPAWLSPLAWGDLAYPFTTGRPWNLAAYVALGAALAGAAFVLSARRDLGQGMIPVRPGRPEARAVLLSPLGLAVRLQRGLWMGWAAGAVVFGLTTGFFTDEFGKLIEDNEAAREMFAALGGGDVLRDNALAAMMTWMGVMFAAFTVQAVLRLHAEEHGALESLLATSTSRERWLASHVAVAFGGSALLLLVAGVCAGVSGAAVMEDADMFVDLLVATMVQLPAMLVVGAVAVLAFGISSRLAVPVGWGAFALCVFTLFGEMFRVPDRMTDLSPFSHVPLMPAEPFSGWPLVVLVAVAISLVATGARLFHARDAALA